MEAFIEQVRAKVYELRSKKQARDFTRSRKMSFTDIVYAMVRMVNASTQTMLERVFPQLRKENLQMSRQAFSAARRKIKWEAFKELLRASVEGSYHEDCTWWRGWRVMGIDGSFIQLPASPGLQAYFGALGHEGTSPMALGPILYDLENDIIIDAKLAPVRENGRSLALEHLEALTGLESFKAGHRELVIFDRGYPSDEFIGQIETLGIDYVMRAQKGFNREADRREARDGRVTLGKSGRRVRCIKAELPGGERETLISSLTEGEAEWEAFKELYHKRWKIETKYGAVKKKLEPENFPGRLAETVKQDFYAVMTAANMTAGCVREAKREREGKRNRYEYEVNVNHAAGVYKDWIIRVLIAEDRISRDYLMRQLVRHMKGRAVPVRPGREVPRKERPRQARFHHNHKSNC